MTAVAFLKPLVMPFLNGDISERDLNNNNTTTYNDHKNQQKITTKEKAKLTKLAKEAEAGKATGSTSNKNKTADAPLSQPTQTKQNMSNSSIDATTSHSTARL